MSNLIYQIDQTKRRSQISTLNYFIPSFKELSNIIQSGPINPLPDDYVKYYEKVAEVFPQIPENYSLLGYCYYMAGEKGGAIKAFEKAIELNSVNFWAFYDLAIILRAQGDYRQSIVLLSKAVGLNPHDVLNSILSAFVYQQIIRSEDFHYDIPGSLHLGYAKAFYLLGLNFQSLGNAEMAQKFFAQSKSLLSNKPLSEDQIFVQIL